MGSKMKEKRQFLSSVQIFMTKKTFLATPRGDLLVVVPTPVWMNCPTELGLGPNGTYIDVVFISHKFLTFPYRYYQDFIDRS